jgi:putative PIN family toxin of toxin-antitoxin system
MQDEVRRIVLDTNCLLAILPSRSPYHMVWTDFLDYKIELCVSPEILLEYEEILSQKASLQIAEIVLKILATRRNVKKIEPSWRFNMIKSDPDDNKFVDCAICGNAEFIVSNDSHFNSVKEIDFPIIAVLKLQEFVELLLRQ